MKQTMVEKANNRAAKDRGASNHGAKSKVWRTTVERMIVIECNLICFVWRTQPWSKFSLVQTNQIAFDYENIGSIQFTCAWWDKTSTRCYVVCTPVCWWYSEFLVGSSTGETRHTAHVGLCCCRFYIARWIFSKKFVREEDTMHCTRFRSGFDLMFVHDITTWNN